jgi:1L-myo-inositol 1-phosphate cytidylyltransferase / CDP-L-myo-inositol myo-inositolphosphotransferase
MQRGKGTELFEPARRAGSDRATEPGDGTAIRPLVVPAARPTRPGVPPQAVVLAAGRSERLRAVTGGGSKALVRLGGLTLVERAVRTLFRSGVGRVLVVVGYHAGPVGAVVSRFANGRARVILARDWEAGNGASLAAAEGAVAEDDLFVLLTTDHVFSDGALDALLRAGEPAVLVDPTPTQPVWDEGCRVRTADGRVVALGKHLDEPWVDCGAFLLPPSVFEHQRAAASEGDHTLAGATSKLATATGLQPVGIADRAWWQDVDTPEDLRLAQGMLRRSLTKDADGPVSRFLNRPISTRVSMALAPLRVSPDLVSVIAMALTIVAGWFLSRGAGVAGGVLVAVASIVDGMDGEFARLQLRAGPRGAFLDGILDRVGDTAILVGLGLWALDGSLTPSWAVGLTAAGLAGSMLSMASKDRTAALGLPEAPERRLALLLGGRDGRLLLITVFAIVGSPAGALIAVAVTSLVTLSLRAAIVLARARRLAG